MTVMMLRIGIAALIASVIAFALFPSIILGILVSASAIFVLLADLDVNGVPGTDPGMDAEQDF